jgi:putative ABC transport system permease protein
MLALVALVLLMAMLSSSYPSLFLSSFSPVQALKGKLKVGRAGSSFRNGLVVFQFTMSIVMMICTAIVFQQLRYVSEKDIGFDKENLLVLEHVEGLKNGETIARAAMNLPGVINASWCTSLPPTIWGGDRFSAEGLNGTTFPLNYTSGDEHFISTLNIKLKVGREFSADSPGDEDRVILNEAAIRKIGWKMDESVIGRKIQLPGGDTKWEVAGVASDFNYWSLENPIEPMAIFHIKNKNVNPGERQFLALRIKPQGSEAWKNTLDGVKELWKTHAGDAPFQYTFVDETFAETFKTQYQFGTVLTVMAVLAILIASLGLLGIVIYSLEQRTKEIGIRKVSGASVGSLLVLIAKGYTKLIFIAFLIGSPLSYWLMHKWLQDFAYRITPSITIFVLTGLCTLMVAVLITCYHSLKAALQNPVDILKDE